MESFGVCADSRVPIGTEDRSYESDEGGGESEEQNHETEAKKRTRRRCVHEAKAPLSLRTEGGDDGGDTVSYALLVCF